MVNRQVNAVIVGSGAGGGVVAKELSTAGVSVVLFERGGWISYDDHTDDELISQPISPLGTSCGPDDKRYRRVIVYPDGGSRIVLPSEADYSNIATGVIQLNMRTGVHEGLSCTACHEPHSNDARKSCLKCHPAISNCKLDVTTMNTTYKDQKSPNNIHWVGCIDCHKEKNFRRN